MAQNKCPEFRILEKKVAEGLLSCMQHQVQRRHTPGLCFSVFWFAWPTPSGPHSDKLGPTTLIGCSCRPFSQSLFSPRWFALATPALPSPPPCHFSTWPPPSFVLVVFFLVCLAHPFWAPLGQTWPHVPLINRWATHSLWRQSSFLAAPWHSCLWGLVAIVAT